MYITTKAMTAEEQSKLMPSDVINELVRGNSDFINNVLSLKYNTERLRTTCKGQFPKAVVLACLDSRVLVEDIFQCSIGDIFVIRIAGNIVNPDILGSMEFACKIAGAKLVVVLGHTRCGAIMAAIDDFKFENLTGLLNRIQPAVALSKTNFDGETTSSNLSFVENVCRNNVEISVNEIRKSSPSLKQMEENGYIKIIGAIYNIETGKVDFF